MRFKDITIGRTYAVKRLPWRDSTVYECEVIDLKRPSGGPLVQVRPVEKRYRVAFSGMQRGTFHVPPRQVLTSWNKYCAQREAKRAADKRQELLDHIQEHSEVSALRRVAQLLGMSFAHKGDTSSSFANIPYLFLWARDAQRILPELLEVAKVLEGTPPHQCIDGWVPAIAGVVRCDVCQRFESDDAARDYVAEVLLHLWTVYQGNSEADSIVLPHIRRALREEDNDAETQK